MAENKVQRTSPFRQFFRSSSPTFIY